MKYKIVFRGKLNPTISAHEVIENLAELFDEPVDIVRQKYFESDEKEIIMISGLNSQDASEYKSALLEAGLFSDMDLDLDEIDLGFDTTASTATYQKKEIKAVNLIESSELMELIDPIESEVALNRKDISRQFLEVQDFTLIKHEDDAQSGEINRVEKLKKIAKKQDDKILIDDRDSEAIPPLFNSGVRIGRVRFIYRITLAFAVLLTCFNVIPMYLQEFFGGSGIFISIVCIFTALIFVLIVITQRFCDIDNLSIGKMTFVVVILITLIFSFLINDYYALSEEKIKFANRFLQTNAMEQDYFSLQELLDTHMHSVSETHLLQKIDSVIKWFVYITVIVGAIALFALPGIAGNNQFGSPTNIPGAKSMIIFILSFFLLLYSAAYPFSTKELRAQHRLYQGELYEYFGLLKPLPQEFETAYKEYLQKNSTKAK